MFLYPIKPKLPVEQFGGNRMQLYGGRAGGVSTYYIGGNRMRHRWQKEKPTGMFTDRSTRRETCRCGAKRMTIAATNADRAVVQIMRGPNECTGKDRETGMVLLTAGVQEE